MIPYLTRIEYIETSGNCLYITSCIPQGGNIKISTKFLYNGWAGSAAYYSWYSAYTNEGSQIYRVMRTASNSNGMSISNGGKGSGSVYDAPFTASVGTIYTIETNGRSVTVNNTHYTITRAIEPTANTSPMRIFHTYFKGRFYYMKIYNGDELILDLFPVRIGNKGYLYDALRNKLINNSLTGTPTLGPDTEVLYANEVAFLESWGNQYIDTGIKPSTDTKIELKCLYCKSGAGLTNYGALIGADDRSNAYILNHSAIANFTYGLEFSNNFANPQTRLLTFNSTAAPHNLRVYDEGGSLVTTLTCIRGVFEVNQNLYLFAANRGGTPVYGSNRILYCKIYDGDTLVRDYVPVEYNGVGYMYDKVSGLFFDNQGTGKFLFGSIAKACARSYTRRQLMAKAPEEDWSKHYLTFKVLSAGTITIKASHSAVQRTFQYSTDKGNTWQTLTTSTTVQSFGDFNAGDELLLKGTNSVIGASSSYNCFGGTSRFDLRGNIMSLLYGDNFYNQKSLSGKTACFMQLFCNCTAITGARHLILPATTLATNCYKQMFQGCSNLTTAPKLPALTMQTYCYHGLFYGCSKLVEAPELPSTALADYCYWQMFYNCTSLTKAPAILPAATLKTSCYNNMFYGCSNLVKAPTISATTTASNCCRQMFQNCTKLTAAPVLLPTSAATYCYCSMFEGCSNLVTAPASLPATTLGTYCYSYMFKRTKLGTAPSLPATTLQNNCYQQMFMNCTSLLSAPELPATALVSNCYANMFHGCSRLNYIKAMFTTTPGTSYTNSWVYGVASRGTFVKNSAATWENVRSTSCIPSGWTIETASE